MMVRKSSSLSNKGRGRGGGSSAFAGGKIDLYGFEKGRCQPCDDTDLAARGMRSDGVRYEKHIIRRGNQFMFMAGRILVVFGIIVLVLVMIFSIERALCLGPVIIVFGIIVVALAGGWRRFKRAPTIKVTDPRGNVTWVEGRHTERDFKKIMKSGEPKKKKRKAGKPYRYRSPKKKATKKRK